MGPYWMVIVSLILYKVKMILIVRDLVSVDSDLPPEETDGSEQAISVSVHLSCF